MYDHVVRAQRPSALEWLVVNALIPTVLVTFVLHAVHMTRAVALSPRVDCYSGFLFPPDDFKPPGPIPDVFPALIRMPEPDYPKRLRRARVEDRVVLRAVVDAQGHVDSSSILVIQGIYPQMVASARRALSRAVFRPGRFGGRHIAAWATIGVDFTLQWGVTR
jgi:TonB family protein